MISQLLIIPMYVLSAPAISVWFTERNSWANVRPLLSGLHKLCCPAINQHFHHDYEEGLLTLELFQASVHR